MGLKTYHQIDSQCSLSPPIHDKHISASPLFPSFVGMGMIHCRIGRMFVRLLAFFATPLYLERSRWSSSRYELGVRERSWGEKVCLVRENCEDLLEQQVRSPLSEA
jgi:hypothetical protein